MKAPLVQKRQQAPEGRQRRPGVLPVHRHPAPGPQQLPHHRLLEQLHLGDIVERRRQRHADERDVFPALVLGADDGRPPGRQMFQALDPQGAIAPDGLPVRTSGPGDRRWGIGSGSWQVEDETMLIWSHLSAYQESVKVERF